MLDFSLIFSSRSRVSVLLILSQQTEPLRLREIQALSSMEINPIRTAINDLVDERILRVRRNQGVQKFCLNEKSKSYGSLLTVLEEIKRSELKDRAERLGTELKKSSEAWLRIEEMSFSIAKSREQWN